MAIINPAQMINRFSRVVGPLTSATRSTVESLIASSEGVSHERLKQILRRLEAVLADNNRKLSPIRATELSHQLLDTSVAQAQEFREGFSQTTSFEELLEDFNAGRLVRSALGDTGGVDPRDFDPGSINATRIRATGEEGNIPTNIPQTREEAAETFIQDTRTGRIFPVTRGQAREQLAKPEFAGQFIEVDRNGNALFGIGSINREGQEERGDFGGQGGDPQDRERTEDELDNAEERYRTGQLTISQLINEVGSGNAEDIIGANSQQITVSSNGL